MQVSKIFNILSEFVSVNPDCVQQYLLSLRVWSLMISSCMYQKLYVVSIIVLWTPNMFMSSSSNSSATSGLPLFPKFLIYISY